MEYKRIILKANKDKSLQRKHPWLFSGAIAKKSSDIKEGDIVEIFSYSGNYIATGYFQNETIAVKILTFHKQTIDRDFFFKRIQSAVCFRQTMGLFDNDDTTMFRLVNSEGDFLPGLIADYYDKNIVIQFHSLGMARMQAYIVDALKDCLPQTLSIYCKSSSTLPKNDEIPPKDGFLFNKNSETPDFFIAKENNCSYYIDYLSGQKTGFFIDQRNNRELVSNLSKDKNVLNCFCYTGGFSVAALNGGAKQTDSLDISKRALEICDKNVKLNKFEKNHKSLAVDVLDYINNIPNDLYDIIILDPPAFAKHNKDLKQALKGYRAINQKAMEKIKAEGLLFTFSCSQAVSTQEFLTMLFSCSVLANRKVRIVKRLAHNTDHPQSIFHPEGEYLKGFLLYIE